jgi:hypothetical protein
MRACTMANGAVFFIPDEIEQKTKSVAYADLLEKNEQDTVVKKMSLFDRLMKRDRIAAQEQSKAA